MADLQPDSSRQAVECAAVLVHYVEMVEDLRRGDGHDPGNSIRLDSTGDVTDSEGVRFWNSGNMLTTLNDACKAKKKRTGEPMQRQRDQ